ncbi:MAG: sulfatase-like hydrolase/transferase, partial [Candidatus Hydrogenedentes bacterium]|nr:sulfatase-like hydrolase/transferase [Candidatus Hydrogenedentota bacterium]
RHKDEPFFLYYPMCLTHGPFYPTPDTWKEGEPRQHNDRANFGANVEYMDKLVGRIVAALDEAGLRDDTVLFFTTDNGTGGAGKGTVTEAGCRVPMIVNGPGHVKRLGARKELVDFSDMLPTLAEFAGAQLPDGYAVDGGSFAPLLRGDPYEEREWIFSYLADKRMLRDKRWLLEGDGRFFDCGASRDGAGYADVTDSEKPDVAAARQRFERILEGLPGPAEDDPLLIRWRESEPARKRRQQRQQQRQQQ